MASLREMVTDPVTLPLFLAWTVGAVLLGACVGVFLGADACMGGAFRG